MVAMDARFHGATGFVRASTVLKQTSSRSRKCPFGKELEALTEAWAALMLFNAGLEVVGAEDPSQQPERQEAPQVEPSAHQSFVRRIQKTPATPSRVGRTLPTVLEVSEDGGDPISTAARFKVEDEPAPTLKAGLLFHRSVGEIATPIKSSIKPTTTVKSPSRTFGAVAIRQPLAPSSTSEGWTLRSPAKSSSLDVQPASNPQTSGCSSCGTVGHHANFSTLKPCSHLLCRVCVNTLVNSACLDPPPDALRCFLCSAEVTGFDKIQAEPSPLRTPARVEIVDPTTGMELSPVRQLDWSATPSSTKSTTSSSADDVSSLWSTPKSQTSMRSAISTPSSSAKKEPRARASWPVVRIDNISWKLSVAQVLEWLPDEGLLPPAEACPSPIHILCTPDDGKTLNYAFVELRDLASAHRLVRERGPATRQVPRIGGRPCSVSLASPDELSRAIFARPTIVELSKMLLKLCDVTRSHVQKAPERPFLHLAAIASHLDGHQQDDLPKFWRDYEAAVAKAKGHGLTDALAKMVATVAACEVVDHARKLRISQLVA